MLGFTDELPCRTGSLMGDLSVTVERNWPIEWESWPVEAMVIALSIGL